PIARKLLGSTAATLAEKASCPVAIIRTPHDAPAGDTDPIVVVVDDHPDNESVIEHGMAEARLRKAPVLAVGVWQEQLGEMPYDELDRRVETWQQRYPDVRVYPVATRDGVARFLAANKERPVQLAVVGGADAGQIARIIGPHNHPLIQHGECSVLVVH
ncbi:MAG: universal stress protein, partial [Mycobacterium sp.]